MHCDRPDAGSMLRIGFRFFFFLPLSQIIALVAANASTSRLSAIGLGQGASTALVSGIARAGNGRALFVRDELVLRSSHLFFSPPFFYLFFFSTWHISFSTCRKNLREAVLDVLNCSLQPWLTDVTVDWRLTRSSKPITPILQIPSRVPPVFGGTFTTLVALIPPGNGLF